MKMILSAILTLSTVAAFANPTTATGPAHGSAPAAATTGKEAKAITKVMTKDEAEKACAKEANKEACVKKHTGSEKKM